jgi:hypothetical protein
VLGAAGKIALLILTKLLPASTNNFASSKLLSFAIRELTRNAI